MSDVGIYIHIPFCHHRCTYCDFNIYAGMRLLYERYAHAVAKEIASHSPSPLTHLPPSGALFVGEGHHAPTIYFGGGTPSMVPVEHIGLILDAIRETFDVAPDAEITLEANPHTDGDGYFERLRGLGVNRVSLGMQSALERDLRLFRRGHTFEDVVGTFQLARAAGFDNLNLDLIYGIPGQSLDDWRTTLEAALSLDPDHISAYGLQVEDGTTLKKWIMQAKAPAPDDDLAADMFNCAEETLEEAGFMHYEISNWARATPTSNFQLPTSICRHNLIYWRNEPYLGFGCGAHSWFDGRRFSNVRHVRAYVDAIEAGQGAKVEAESISLELEMGETMMVGLRLLDEGVTFERFTSRFGVELREVYRKEIERLMKMELIDLDVARVKLSRHSQLIGNRVFREFLPKSTCPFGCA